MTSSQFSGIIDRLTKFTSQNLKKLIMHMNLDSFFANVDKLAVSKNCGFLFWFLKLLGVLIF